MPVFKLTRLKEICTKWFPKWFCDIPRRRQVRTREDWKHLRRTNLRAVKEGGSDYGIWEWVSSETAVCLISHLVVVALPVDLCNFVLQNLA